MSFEKRVVDGYQYVLNDLNSGDIFLITALTMLALDDIKYHKAIGKTIAQHILSVRNTYFLIIFLVFFFLYLE